MIRVLANRKWPSGRMTGRSRRGLVAGGLVVVAALTALAASGEGSRRDPGRCWTQDAMKEPFQGRGGLPVSDGQVQTVLHRSLATSEVRPLEIAAVSIAAAGSGRTTTGEAGHEPPGWSRQLIRLSEQSKSVIFLPENLLQSVPLEDLPIRAEDRSLLRSVVRDTSSGRRPRCAPSRWSGRPGTVEPFRDLPEMIANSESSFVGTIQSVESGWSPWLAHVAQLADVRIESVVHNIGSGQLQPGAEVWILFRGGQIRFQDVEICEDPPTGFYRPEVGNTILSTGWPGWDPRFFNATATFKVEDGMVVPEPFSNLDPHAIPRPLGLIEERVRQELRSGQETPCEDCRGC